MDYTIFVFGIISYLKLCDSFVLFLGSSIPATMVTTGDHDGRVVPAHSFKFAAELQEKQCGSNSTLIRIDMKAGNGIEKSLEATIQENADIPSFYFIQYGFQDIAKNVIFSFRYL